MEDIEKKVADLIARQAECARLMVISEFQTGHLLARLAEDVPLGNVEQIREFFKSEAAKPTAYKDPLLDAYRLALLARHVPFDDWGGEDDLARQTLAAVEAELLELAPDLPPRALLLLDSLERVVRRFAGIEPDSDAE